MDETLEAAIRELGAAGDAKGAATRALEGYGGELVLQRAARTAETQAS